MGNHRGFEQENTVIKFALRTHQVEKDECWKKHWGLEPWVILGLMVVFCRFIMRMVELRTVLDIVRLKNDWPWTREEEGVKDNSQVPGFCSYMEKTFIKIRKKRKD
jgi:hypothetical protein